MVNRMKIFGFLLSLLFLAACGANAEPIIRTAEPVAVVDAPPTATQPATATPTIEILPTVTLAPTNTRSASTTNEPLSNPLRPTFTQAPATQTATFALANTGVSIEYFLSNADRFQAGDSVTLFWSVIGSVEAVRVFRLNADDERIQVWNVAQEGRLTVATDTENESTAARFLLLAEANGNSIDELLEIEVSACTFGWFFLPAPDTCPEDAPQPSTQVIQPFENGLMIWLALTDQIFVVYADGEAPVWETYPDTFEEGVSADRDDLFIPPPERLQPVRGFGLVWRENTGVRDRLGWATEPELAIDGVIQTSTDATYLRDRDGGIIALTDEGWEIIPVTDVVPTPIPEDIAPADATPTEVPSNQ